jgi:hypothetical protein
MSFISNLGRHGRHLAQRADAKAAGTPWHRLLCQRPHAADLIGLYVGDFGRHEAVNPNRINSDSLDWSYIGISVMVGIRRVRGARRRETWLIRRRLPTAGRRRPALHRLDLIASVLTHALGTLCSSVELD